MSIRTDAGVCRFCGSVLVLDALEHLDVPDAVDAYACSECIEQAREAGLLA